MTLVLSALSTAPVGVGWRMLLAIIATVIAIMFTRPVRSFKAMAGMDPNKSDGRLDDEAADRHGCRHRGRQQGLGQPEAACR